mmetsp:Transcript_18832/g.49933  ORF Transcript_18832/g.49933 Transcript_18832/m.49933 type:complete len:228 (-) Transcript_18832:1254-1937(-)
MNCFSASPILSWRSVRRRKSRWNGDRSRALLGRSAVSGRSSPNQRFQPKESCSTDSVSLPPFLKASMPSRDFSCAHCVSVSQVFALSGMTPALGSGGARMSILDSSRVIFFPFTRILIATIVEIIILSTSRRPRRVKENTAYVMVLSRSCTRSFSSLPESSMISSSSSSSSPLSSSSSSSSCSSASSSSPSAFSFSSFGGSITFGFRNVMLFTARVSTITKESREYL